MMNSLFFSFARRPRPSAQKIADSFFLPSTNKIRASSAAQVFQLVFFCTILICAFLCLSLLYFGPAVHSSTSSSIRSDKSSSAAASFTSSSSSVSPVLTSVFSAFTKSPSEPSPSSVGDTPSINCDEAYEETASDRCYCAQQISDSYVNYAALYFCHLSSVPPLGTALLIVLLFFIFKLLTGTTEHYLVPCLEQTTKFLQLSPNIAGVTLLAFGNGAADVFPTITSMQSTDGSLAVGSAIGVGLVLCALILSLIILAAAQGEEEKRENQRKHEHKKLSGMTGIPVSALQNTSIGSASMAASPVLGAAHAPTIGTMSLGASLGSLGSSLSNLFGLRNLDPPNAPAKKRRAGRFTGEACCLGFFTSRSELIRDVAFYWIATLYFLLLFVQGSIQLWQALLFLVWYAFYVSFVIFQRVISQQHKQAKAAEDYHATLALNENSAAILQEPLFSSSISLSGSQRLPPPQSDSGLSADMPAVNSAQDTHKLNNGEDFKRGGEILEGINGMHNDDMENSVGGSRKAAEKNPPSSFTANKPQIALPAPTPVSASSGTSAANTISTAPSSSSTSPSSAAGAAVTIAPVPYRPSSRSANYDAVSQSINATTLNNSIGSSSKATLALPPVSANEDGEHGEHGKAGDKEKKKKAPSTLRIIREVFAQLVTLIMSPFSVARLLTIPMLPVYRNPHGAHGGHGHGGAEDGKGPMHKYVHWRGQDFLVAVRPRTPVLDEARIRRHAARLQAQQAMLQQPLQEPLLEEKQESEAEREDRHGDRDAQSEHERNREDDLESKTEKERRRSDVDEDGMDPPAALRRERSDSQYSDGGYDTENDLSPLEPSSDPYSDEEDRYSDYSDDSYASTEIPTLLFDGIGSSLGDDENDVRVQRIWLAVSIIFSPLLFCLVAAAPLEGYIITFALSTMLSFVVYRWICTLPVVSVEYYQRLHEKEVAMAMGGEPIDLGDDEPPPSRLPLLIVFPDWAVYTLLTASTIMACIWIYIIADELVALLDVLGEIMGLSPMLMGLTVLSLGNSLGDLVASISFAKSGHADMAATGCFGGASFNHLVGLGLGLVVRILRSETEFTFIYNPLIPLAFLFLLGSLFFIPVFVGFSDFRYTRLLAYLLFVCYGIFLLLTFLTEFGAVPGLTIGESRERHRHRY